MDPRKVSFTEAKQIPITEYLAGLGFEPAKIRGEDYWYHSPFREERTPSFKVNAKLNLWYDHGTGEGGTILDFGAKLHQCSLVEFLEKLSEGNSTFSLHRQPSLTSKQENTLEILAVTELQNPELRRYLDVRSISFNTARLFCNEVEFRIREKAYKAIGFPNRSGAWELRNSWFKGSSAPKDISLIENGSSKLAVLEGFMDFLSLQQTEQKEIQNIRNDSNFLILNSLQLLSRTIPLFHSHKEVHLFLDNDLAAHQAKENLKEKGIKFRDASSLYEQHKDVNEFLVASHKAEARERVSPRRSRRIGR